MTIVDLNDVEGRTYPARRRTQNLVGGPSPAQSDHFSFGYVTLEPNGGQVPWHNQEQDEIYFIVSGTGEMCLDDERTTVHGGQMIFIPPQAFHQLTNIGDEPLTMIYCYGPGGRGGALAAGARRHAPQGWHRRPAASRRCSAAVHRSAGGRRGEGERVRGGKGERGKGSVGGLGRVRERRNG